MDTFWWVVLGTIAYFVVGRFVASRYAERRHGMATTSLFDPGAIGAALVGLAWPATMFMERVRHPQPCDDRECLLLRARVIAEYTNARDEEDRLIAEYRARHNR